MGGEHGGGLEEELKAANAKGRLWEACASRGLASPTVQHGKVGDRHRVQMELELGEWGLTSGAQWGWSRKVAEQLAAQALLEELHALERDEPGLRPARVCREPEDLGEDVFEVDPSDVARHRQSNPKGQVFEWCQRQKPPVRRPRFEARKVRGGRSVVRARLETRGLESPWFFAARRKDAEQAAAEALLLLLPMDEEAPELDALATANPRTRLNDLVHHGPLAACEVEVIERQGPAHAPVFTARGHARFEDGRVVQGEACEGSSKREAITKASRSLLALVE